MPDQPTAMFSSADVEVARQRLNDNRYGGPDDLHDLDPEDIHEIVQLVLTATWDRIYDEGLAEGRRQATEGWERHWGVRFEDVDDVQRFATEASARQLAGASDTVMARLVGPWEPAEQQPEHAFDESSVVNPATGEPYRGSSGPEPYEPPDPLCVCGASWLGDEGCLTQQPGWTPPPPYDGPSIEELLPGKEPGCPTCSGPVRETVGMICQTCGTDYASGGVVEPFWRAARSRVAADVAERVREAYGMSGSVRTPVVPLLPEPLLNGEADRD